MTNKPKSESQAHAARSAKSRRRDAVVKQCLAYIRRRDGSAQIVLARLESDLSFALSEMETWLRNTYPPGEVESVECYAIPGRRAAQLQAVAGHAQRSSEQVVPGDVP